MASRFRSKIERERDLVEVAALYLRAETQESIARIISGKYYPDNPLSRQQIGYDIRTIIKRWRKDAVRDISERKAEELARIDALEREYWDAWERSQKNAETDTVMDGPKGKTLISKKEGQVGDPRFLEGVYRCIDKRCEILGLNAPTKLAGVGDKEDKDAFIVKVLKGVSTDDL